MRSLSSRLTAISLPTNVIGFTLLLSTLAAIHASAAGMQDLVSQLTHQTQELYDALVPGNQEPWKKYFADDCIFADEKGRLFNKAQLVHDVAPMPAGYSGSIKVENVQSRVVSDTAILSYDINESETIFGQELHARYHTTDTWLRRNNVWEIIASQAHRYYEDPAVGDADPSKFADFAGAYELTPGQTRTVTADNGKLFVERKGKKEELLPEATDIFFRKGVEGRILFRRDKQSGAVVILVDRRNNEDVLWKKRSG
jgi:Domain of unknown function (DUF4440)